MQKHEIISAIATLSATIELFHILGKWEEIDILTEKIMQLVSML